MGSGLLSFAAMASSTNRSSLCVVLASTATSRLLHPGVEAAFLGFLPSFCKHAVFWLPSSQLVFSYNLQRFYTRSDGDDAC